MQPYLFLQKICKSDDGACPARKLQVATSTERGQQVPVSVDPTCNGVVSRGGGGDVTFGSSHKKHPLQVQNL